MSLRKLPTHAELTTFLSTFLPPSPNPETQAREVQFLYHTPRHPQYIPTTQLTSRVVFSVTPTKGVYTALETPSSRHISPVCFLHRPFNLDRRRVRRGALVLASHKSFDERLTVGWNVALGERIGVEIGSAVCVQGYKGDSERKIGLVGRLERSKLLSELVGLLRGEFSGEGELFTSTAAAGSTVAVEPGDVGSGHVESCIPTGSPEAGNPIESMITVVAIMNAFHAEEVQRVLIAAYTAGWINDVNDGRQILYLTGAARPCGVEAVAKVGMPAFCVGHVACEEWGIRYLARQTRERWPVLDVVEVFEEEEPRPALVKVEVKTNEVESIGVRPEV